ncbi:MAG: hypothetical protein Q4C70_12285 [Planctomycetia bacterium]|nr:hypothetical protein [Planctomycetia bacterium]
MKNKTLFILLLALCPLLVLTGASLLDFFKVPPRSVPNDQELIMDLARNSYTRQEKVRTARALQEGLAEVHLILPLPTENSVFINNMARYGTYEPDMAYLRSWNTVLGNLSGFLRPLRKINAESLADMENITEENRETSEAAFKSVQKAHSQLVRNGKDFSESLVGFSEKNPDTKLAEENETIRTKVGEMTALVTERVDRARDVHEAKRLFLDAQAAFDAENYEDAFRLCNKVLVNKNIDAEFQLEVRRIGYSARAKMAMTKLAEIEESTFRPETKTEQIEELAQKVSEAGKGLDREERKSLAEAYHEKKFELLVNYIEETYLSEIEEDLALLQKTPPKSFISAVSDAGEIMTKIKTMDEKLRKSTENEMDFPHVSDLRKRSVEILTPILDERLPSETEVNDKIQEAELRDGKIVSGYFRAVEENGKTTGYKIYSSYEEYQNPTASKGVTSIDDFHTLPGASLEARLAEEYLEARGKLMKNLGKRPSWNEFLGKCERMEKELTTWEEKSQVKATFSVKKATAIAKGVLKPENWDIMAEIYR